MGVTVIVGRENTLTLVMHIVDGDHERSNPRRSRWADPTSAALPTGQREQALRREAPEARRLVRHGSRNSGEAGLVHGIDHLPKGQRCSLQRC